MVYSLPPKRRITFSLPSAPSLAPLVCQAALEAPIWTRAIVGGFVPAGKTRAGATRINRDGYKPYFVWTGDLLLKRVDLGLLDRINSLIQNDVTTQVVLRDEFEYVDLTQAGWHNRQQIAGSQVSEGGVSRCYCQFNVLLVVNGEYAQYQGDNYYRVNFTAEELI